MLVGCLDRTQHALFLEYLWGKIGPTWCADMTEPRDRAGQAAADLEHGDAELGRQAAYAINQRIFETSIDLLLVCDKRGGIIRVSPSSEAILGYGPEEMIGRIASPFIHPEDLDPTREEMRQARRGRATRHFDSRYIHRDGRIVPLAWTGVWSEAEQQHFFIGRDMTERLAAEERMRHAQRLEAIGQLTGGIAHDFNNLLAIVVGNLDLLFDDPHLDPKVRVYVEAAMHAAQRGADLTRGLLAFSRRQPLDPRVIDANALIGNLSRMLARTLGQQIEVEFSAGAGIGPVFIDPANLESAIANLAVNARDAMPDGGRLLIETQNATHDDEYVRLNCDAVRGDYVSVVVTDTGCGMPPEVLSRVFEPYFTTKDVGKGTGLGLSTVFGFVRQSGGYIKVYSEVGHGTTVRVYLPRAPGDAVLAAPAVQAKPERGKQETVLVVEDNDAIRQLVLLQLGGLGYRSLEADGAAAALSLLQAGEAVDLLFTDIVMPGGQSGHELARKALELRPGLKVLFTSGFPDAVLARSHGIEGDAMLGKPYRQHELAQKVRAMLDS